VLVSYYGGIYRRNSIVLYQYPGAVFGAGADDAMDGVS